MENNSKLYIFKVVTKNVCCVQIIAPWEIVHAFFRLLILFKIIFFNNSLRVPSEWQIVWIQTRPDTFLKPTYLKISFRHTIKVKQFSSRLGLIWVQTVCKCYQQTTLGGKELNLWMLLTFDMPSIYYLSFGTM